MHLVLSVLALLSAVVAGVRSSWSPCGRSMLSTITPLGERGRNATFAASAAWFVAGAVLGGGCLGAALLVLSASAGAMPVVVAGTLALGAAVAAAASDSPLGRFVLPVHRRQVNERWLDRFRPWVYGAGFGWQIGTGFATYIVGAVLYLTVSLAVLGGRPMMALGVGVVFGTVRGLAVLAGCHITDPAALVAFHRRFDKAEQVVRRAVVYWELAVLGALVGAVVAIVGGPSAGAVSGAALGAAGVGTAARRARAGSLGQRGRKTRVGGATLLPGPVSRTSA